MKPLRCLPTQPDRQRTALAVKPIIEAGVVGETGRISRKLAEALEHLPPHERSAVFFRDVERYPLDFVASQMGCSIRAARLHIAHGRIKLVRYLETLLL